MGIDFSKKIKEFHKIYELSEAITNIYVTWLLGSNITRQPIEDSLPVESGIDRNDSWRNEQQTEPEITRNFNMWEDRSYIQDAFMTKPLPIPCQYDGHNHEPPKPIDERSPNSTLSSEFDEFVFNYQPNQANCDFGVIGYKKNLKMNKPNHKTRGSKNSNTFNYSTRYNSDPAFSANRQRLISCSRDIDELELNEKTCLHCSRLSSEISLCNFQPLSQAHDESKVDTEMSSNESTCSSSLRLKMNSLDHQNRFDEATLYSSMSSSACSSPIRERHSNAFFNTTQNRQNELAKRTNTEEATHYQNNSNEAHNSFLYGSILINQNFNEFNQMHYSDANDRENFFNDLKHPRDKHLRITSSACCSPNQENVLDKLSTVNRERANGISERIIIEGQSSFQNSGNVNNSPLTGSSIMNDNWNENQVQHSPSTSQVLLEQPIPNGHCYFGISETNHYEVCAMETHSRINPLINKNADFIVDSNCNAVTYASVSATTHGNVIHSSSFISSQKPLRQYKSAKKSNTKRSDELDQRVRKEFTEKAVKNKHCNFCEQSGEDKEFYSSHSLKDNFNRNECPVLRAIKCKICGATGDRGHTINYCPTFIRQKRERIVDVTRN